MKISFSFDPSSDCAITLHRVIDAAFGTDNTVNIHTEAAEPHFGEDFVENAKIVFAELESHDESTRHAIVEEHHDSDPTSSIDFANLVLDKDGLPWDAAIHSSTDGDRMTKTGFWKKRKGVPPEVRQAREDELRRLVQGHVPSNQAEVPDGGLQAMVLNDAQAAAFDREAELSTMMDAQRALGAMPIVDNQAQLPIVEQPAPKADFKQMLASLSPEEHAGFRLAEMIHEKLQSLELTNTWLIQIANDLAIDKATVVAAMEGRTLTEADKANVAASAYIEFSNFLRSTSDAGSLLAIAHSLDSAVITIDAMMRA